MESRCGRFWREVLTPAAGNPDLREFPVGAKRRRELYQLDKLMSESPAGNRPRKASPLLIRDRSLTAMSRP